MNSIKFYATVKLRAPSPPKQISLYLKFEITGIFKELESIFPFLSAKSNTPLVYVTMFDHEIQLYPLLTKDNYLV